MYMAYGMTYEQFWYGDPWMAMAYVQAYLVKQKLRNEEMWIQGAYISNAVSVAIANTFGKKRTDYMNKPLDVYPKTDAEEREEARKQTLKLIEMLNSWKIKK